MKADYYNDDEFAYDEYWEDREYENKSEEIAVKKLLKSQKFKTAADIGGGFGRITKLISNYAKETYLVEPSHKMRIMAKKYLTNEKIQIISGSSDKTNLPAHSVDLYTSFRVFHHLPDLEPTFSEIARVLKPNGTILIEFANSLNFKSRLRSVFSGKQISRIPVDIRSVKNIKIKSIPFVNHHPDTILKLLSKNGFKIEKILSVSNFRMNFLKNILPLKILIVLEFVLQPILSSIYFGPSIFVLAKKT